jgi:hypothetical protein
MARRARVAPGGLVYHVLNRSVAGVPLSRKEADEHLLTVCRYVERNALTAGVVERAEDWRWGLVVRQVPSTSP